MIRIAKRMAKNAFGIGVSIGTLIATALVPMAHGMHSAQLMLRTAETISSASTCMCVDEIPADWDVLFNKAWGIDYPDGAGISIESLSGDQLFVVRSTKTGLPIVSGKFTQVTSEPLSSFIDKVPDGYSNPVSTAVSGVLTTDNGEFAVWGIQVQMQMELKSEKCEIVWAGEIKTFALASSETTIAAAGEQVSKFAQARAERLTYANASTAQVANPPAGGTAACIKRCNINYEADKKIADEKHKNALEDCRHDYYIHLIEATGAGAIAMCLTLGLGFGLGVAGAAAALAALARCNTRADIQHDLDTAAAINAKTACLQGCGGTANP